MRVSNRFLRVYREIINADAQGKVGNTGKNSISAKSEGCFHLFQISRRR